LCDLAPNSHPNPALTVPSSDELRLHCPTLKKQTLCVGLKQRKRMITSIPVSHDVLLARAWVEELGMFLPTRYMCSNPLRGLSNDLCSPGPPLGA
jgi:hypothetical protein